MRALVVVAALTVVVGCAGRESGTQQGTAMTSVPIESADGGEKRTDVRPDPVAAAITYVASTDQMMGHSAIGRGEIFRRLVAPTALAGQVEAFESAAAALAETLGVAVDRLTWVESPLTATLVTEGDAAASVDVWAVSVLGAPDSGPPQQAWRTVHVDLTLVDERWLVSEASADAGPTPLGNDLALPAGWEDFSEVAAWPAAVQGVGL